MTCSTSCCPYDTLMVPCNVCMYVHPNKKNTVALLVTSNEAVANKCSENAAKLKYSRTPL